MSNKSLLNIEVAFASIQSYQCVPLQVENGCTIEQAIQQSGILNVFPEIGLQHNRVGIFNKLKTLADGVKEGDRVEIYRPLQQDAMAARMDRLNQQRAKRRLQVKDRV